MKRINQIANDFRVLQAISSLKIQLSDLIELIIAVQQIPAPTFEEIQRANFVEKCFSDLGLLQVQQDELHNVFAYWPGTNGRVTRPVIVTAHLDTVFPMKTDLAVKKEKQLLIGPGIGDNATGVAGIITLAGLILSHKLTPQSDIWFVANVGEEGLGNLRGMRAVVDRFGPHVRYVVVEGGSLGQLMHRAIGARRFRITVETPGGHSWGDFGQPNAIHELSSLVCEIANIQVPRLPKTSFNVGVIEGGTSINSIASSASLLLDLRSERISTLEQLVSKVNSIVAAQRKAARQRQQKVTFRVQQVGDRPVGAISKRDPLVRLAEDALRQVGWQEFSNIAGSTDANVPLSKNIPSVCIGLTTSNNSHRTDEYIDLKNLLPGMQQLLLLTMAAAEF